MGVYWQHTLAQEVLYQGPGIHSGEEVTIRCIPAPPNTGVVFLVKKNGQQVPIAACLENVVSTRRCTTLGREGILLHTVEHLLAALRGLEVDNLFIQVEGSEIPIADGSALIFAQLFLEAGLERQGVERAFWKVEEVFWVKKGRMHMVLFPGASFSISYTFVTGHPLIGVQFAEFEMTKEIFLEEIAPARTFGFAREVKALKDQGLIQGGNLKNAILIGEEEILGDMRFSNELARHKILDIMGDMALTLPFAGHIVALRSGHTLDVELARKIEGFFQEEGDGDV